MRNDVTVAQTNLRINDFMSKIREKALSVTVDQFGKDWDADIRSVHYSTALIFQRIYTEHLMRDVLYCIAMEGFDQTLDSFIREWTAEVN